MHDNNGNPPKSGTTTPVVYDTLPAAPIVNYSALPGGSGDESQRTDLEQQLRDRLQMEGTKRGEVAAKVLAAQGKQSDVNTTQSQQTYTGPTLPQQSPAARLQVEQQQLSGQNQFQQQQSRSVAGPQLPQAFISCSNSVCGAS